MKKWRTVAQIRERRAELLDEIDAILAIVKAENREPTEDETAKIEEHVAENEQLDKDEAFAEKLETQKAAAAARKFAAGIPPLRGGDGASTGDAKPKVFASPIQPLRAFKGPNAEQDAHDVGMWLRASFDHEQGHEAREYCRQHGIGIRADGQTADDFSKGGLFVPSALSNAIIRVVSEVGIARRLADVVPMNTETLDMSRRSGGLTVYAPGEQETITTSEVTWNRISLTVRDRATLCRISNKLLRSSTVGIAERVAEEIGYAFALQQDNEFILGDGTATYFNEVGLKNAIGSAGTNTLPNTSGDTWAEITLSSFTDTMALLPSKWYTSPAWVCSAPFYNSVMLRLLNAGGGNTNQLLAGGVGMGQFLGYPVFFTDRMPTSTATSTIMAYFGNYRGAAMIGDRIGVQIASSSERYFDSDEIAIRGKIAYDINVYEGGDGSNAGAYVALKTGAP